MYINLIPREKLIHSIILIMLVFSLIPITPMAKAAAIWDEKPKLVGYYASWAAYSGYTPDKIDLTKLTHLNYSFANIDDELKITLGDPQIDEMNFRRLNEMRWLNPDLKILVSVGGWTWSDKFSDVALTEESRKIFAKSAVDFVTKYNLDGIDIDWEFPVAGGLSTNKTRPEDKENFTLLLQRIRKEFDKQGKRDGRYYTLTFAGSAGTIGVENLELEKIHNYVDFANVMTYDLHGVWDKYTDFNAPLYRNEDSPNYVTPSVDESINSWINAGFPREKIVMGISFSGKIYDNVGFWNNGLYQEYSGGSSIRYDEIISKYLYKPGLYNQDLNRYFHWETMSPWIYDGNSFISYEDEVSIGYKADYIKTNGLAGSMIWELSEDRSGILLDRLYNSLQYKNAYINY